jgi:hypothetical protein
VGAQPGRNHVAGCSPRIARALTPQPPRSYGWRAAGCPPDLICAVTPCVNAGHRSGRWWVGSTCVSVDAGCAFIVQTRPPLRAQSWSCWLQPCAHATRAAMRQPLLPELPQQAKTSVGGKRRTNLDRISKTKEFGVGLTSRCSSVSSVLACYVQA